MLWRMASMEWSDLVVPYLASEPAQARALTGRGRSNHTCSPSITIGSSCSVSPIFNLSSLHVSAGKVACRLAVRVIEGIQQRMVRPALLVNLRVRHHIASRNEKGRRLSPPLRHCHDLTVNHPSRDAIDIVEERFTLAVLNPVLLPGCLHSRYT